MPHGFPGHVFSSTTVSPTCSAINMFLVASEWRALTLLFLHILMKTCAYISQPLHTIRILLLSVYLSSLTLILDYGLNITDAQMSAKINEQLVNGMFSQGQKIEGNQEK